MHIWIYFFCLVAIIFATDLDYEEDEIEWECGTDDFSKYISENQVEIDCPALKQNINQCCIHHDKCYDDQLGRKHCDDVFCKCLDDSTVSNQICNKENSPLFCGLVREFGEDAYLRSGNGTISSSNQTETITHDEEKQSEPDVNDYEYIVSHNNTESTLKDDIKKIEDKVREAQGSH